MLKLFGKEEIENWDSLDWQYAIYNYLEDLKEESEKSEYIFERNKPYMNLGLFRAEQKMKTDNKKNSLKDLKSFNKVLQDSLKEGEKIDFEIVESSNEDNVFSEEIPIILEE